MRRGYDRVESSIGMSYDEIKGVTMSVSRDFDMLGHADMPAHLPRQARSRHSAALVISALEWRQHISLDKHGPVIELLLLYLP